MWVLISYPFNAAGDPAGRRVILLGHKQGSLVFQIQEKLSALTRYGKSKHSAKAGGEYKKYIYSYKTFKDYLDKCCRFAKFCKSNHNCKTIEACKPYANQYLQSLAGKESAWTIKAVASAIAKLYGISSKELDKTPSRHRADIKRSRGEAKQDKHFSEAKNAELVSFLKATGLRRSEAESLRGNQLRYHDKQYFIAVEGNQGKGGRERELPVIGNVALVVSLMEKAGDKRVLGDIHSACDVHHYRGVYACNLYKQYARPYKVCLLTPFYDKERGRLCLNSVYRCRTDKKGCWYDKQAMLTVSKALGHNRISVIASNYLYDL